MDKPRVSVSWSKRGFDLILAVVALAVLSPVLIAIFLIIKIETAGPALITQSQIGRHGHRFLIYRFRTGPYPTPDGASFSVGRMTRVGRFLNVTGIEALPYLINVVLGDMSFVGPRPYNETRDRLFAQGLSGYDERFQALPGLTGLAQVRGHDETIGARAEFEKQLECDIEYIRNWSFWLDLRTILHAITVAFKP